MRRREAGVALIVTLVITLIVAVLLTIGTVWVMSGLRGGGVSASRNDLVQLADGVSDQARIQLVYGYQNTKLNTRNYIKSLQTQIGTVNQVPLGTGVTAAWAIKRVSGIAEPYGWVDVHATVRRGQDVQTVVRRISFGDSSVFNLAMLAETTNCMYCHLRVNGDVGSLDFLRPGWGVEGSSGQGSGTSSNISGDLYVASSKTDAAASNITNDSSANTDPQDTTKTTKINGATLSGKLTLRYNGNMLPEDTDGDKIPDFPPIDKETATANATGTITGGSTMKGVPIGGDINKNASNLSSINGVYNGNLVLVGTASNPIVLNGDVYATGDVLIKGYVTGRGAIYSGRNTYVAGDLITAKPADDPGKGVCTNITDKNKCAEANVGASKDEVRLGARGSTIIGDYTERDSSNNIVPVDERQSADYYRSQFGLDNTSTKFYFDEDTGEELTLKSDKTYRTVDGRIVNSSDVTTRTGGSTSDTGSKDAYSYAIRPGAVSGGNFTSWMSDATYRSQYLGTQKMTFNTWRSDIGQETNKETLTAYLSRKLSILTDAGINKTLATTVLTNIYNDKNGDFSDANMTVDVSGSTIRVLINQERDYETQVKRVDAFIYSNRRIAGKTSMSPLAINGGMIGKEIGILAPGRVRPDWAPDKAPYNALNNRTNSCGPTTAYYVPNTEDCAFTLNYDYRLRNGGYGFNLVNGNVGQTVVWKLADAAADQVNP